MIKESPDLNSEKKRSIETSEGEQYLIVEVGSGDAPYLTATTEEYREHFRKNPHIRYVGVEPDEGMLHLGRNFVQREDEKFDLLKTGRVHYVNAEGGRLPFADNSVSELIFRNVIGDREILPSRKIHMIGEAARTLKPGGIMKIIEQYSPKVAREHDVEDYVSTMLQNVFEQVGEAETAGIFDEKETDRRMTTPGKGIERGSFILRFRKKTSVSGEPEVQV